MTTFTLVDPSANPIVAIDSNAIAFLGNTPQGKVTLPAAAITNAQTTALANAIRALLISSGLAQ